VNKVKGGEKMDLEKALGWGVTNWFRYIFYGSGNLFIFSNASVPDSNADLLVDGALRGY